MSTLFLVVIDLVKCGTKSPTHLSIAGCLSQSSSFNFRRLTYGKEIVIGAYNSACTWEALVISSAIFFRDDSKNITPIRSMYLPVNKGCVESVIS